MEWGDDVNLMDGIWGRGRARGYGVTALLAVVVFGASVTAADAVRSANAQQPAGAVYVPSDVPPAPTVSAALAAPTAPPPVVAPVTDPAPATVKTVTTPAPKAAAPQPATVDPQSIGTTGTDGHYTPAPPQVNSGEPPVAPNFGSTGPLGGGDFTPLEGEPGYTGPVLRPKA